ncbi:hypothetical protein LPJ66_000351 [Kickxella alabastrina]|uniref:Uncharacterized protein n=1 Tax=Kickxella alabastrina TaxID=61397 RepID=A0ACC1IWE5_9FUNG|nr:hypothetical protein LPJ66_000351 [Kickxella alabastrina]
MAIPFIDIPVQFIFRKEYGCTCGDCPESKISRRTRVRILYGALQAIFDLNREYRQLESNDILDDSNLSCGYPYNWLPPNVRDPRRETLIGVHNILLVIYAIMQDNGIPYLKNIKEECAAYADKLPFTKDLIECDESVLYIMEELTAQVEGDLRGEAHNMDADDLTEALNQIQPCALDNDLQYWREALCLY